MKQISELRQDLVTGDWVVVATGRARRPNEFALVRTLEPPQPRASCPFERLLPDAFLAFDHQGKAYRRLTRPIRRKLEREWWVEVVPNKYPAFGHGACAVERRHGPYRWQDGVGFHEVVITRDHNRPIAKMSVEETATVLRAYRDRYLALAKDECVRYISIFHNHGREAGASIWHPHSQIIAIPVIPPDVGRSLRGSAEFSKKHGTCVHCVMLDFERRESKRIVFKNRDFVVVCPFVSRQAFEVHIFPKRHNPQFETMGEPELASAAEALRAALAKIDRGLKGPAYNFFIHTAPIPDGVRARHYHWHIEIIPKTAVWAGFEIGTGIEISTIAPETAAAFLRKIKV